MSLNSIALPRRCPGKAARELFESEFVAKNHRAAVQRIGTIMALNGPPQRVNAYYAKQLLNRILAMCITVSGPILDWRAPPEQQNS